MIRSLLTYASVRSAPAVFKRNVGSKATTSTGSRKPVIHSNDGEGTKSDDPDVISFYSSFNMISKATQFETQHTDIELLEPATTDNRVKKVDWINDKKKKLKEKQVLELSNKVKQTTKQRSTLKTMESQQHRQIRHEEKERGTRHHNTADKGLNQADHPAEKFKKERERNKNNTEKSQDLLAKSKKKNSSIPRVIPEEQSRNKQKNQNTTDEIRSITTSQSKPMVNKVHSQGKSNIDDKRRSVSQELSRSQRKKAHNDKNAATEARLTEGLLAKQSRQRRLDNLFQGLQIDLGLK